MSGRFAACRVAVKSLPDRLEDEAVECGGTYDVRFAAVDQDLAGSVDRQQPLTFGCRELKATGGICPRQHYRGNRPEPGGFSEPRCAATCPRSRTRSSPA